MDLGPLSRRAPQPRRGDRVIPGLAAECALHGLRQPSFGRCAVSAPPACIRSAMSPRPVPRGAAASRACLRFVGCDPRNCTSAVRAPCARPKTEARAGAWAPG
jgi:hypothetical protein